MSNLKSIITFDLARYVAAQATADWLSGNVPHGIYRRDRSPSPGEQSFPRECSKLATLTTRLVPLGRVRTETRAQQQLLHATVMNQAFVSMAGYACPVANSNKRPLSGSTTASYGFQLFTRDLNRTGRILEGLVGNEHQAITLAFAINETVKELFSRPHVYDRIERLADDVLTDGFVPGNGINQHMEGLEIYRPTFPDTTLSWSLNRGLSVNNKWARIPSSAQAAA